MTNHDKQPHWPYDLRQRLTSQPIELVPISLLETTTQDVVEKKPELDLAKLIDEIKQYQ